MGTVGLLYWIPEKTECPNGSHPCVPREPRALLLIPRWPDHCTKFLKHPKKSVVGTVEWITTLNDNILSSAVHKMEKEGLSHAS